MLHTPSTHVDVRSDRSETMTKKITDATTVLRPHPNMGKASPHCRDVWPERPEKITTDYRPERNIGRRTTETIPRPRSKPRNETLRQQLRDRLPPPDIPDAGISRVTTKKDSDRQYALSLIYSCLCAARLYGKAIPSLPFSIITRLHYTVKL